jgi:histidyl-tRNA synthetase
LLDYLSPESTQNFTEVKSYLDQLGVSYQVNPRMVRGLDYYTGTTFEFIHEGLGSQSGIGGGGRYDGLMEILGGQSLSGIGFGLGVDRTLLAAQAEGVLLEDQFSSDLFLIPLGENQKGAALEIAAKLRTSGIRTEIAFGDRALKGAMKAADKSGSRYVVVLGDSEITSGSVELKRMSDGSVQSVKIEELQSALLGAL